MTEVVTVVGKQAGRFTPQGGDRQISYYRLYVLNEAPQEGLQGSRTEVIKCDADVFELVELGERITPTYNRYGKMVGVL